MAAHCENGVISNLLNFYGIEVSEALIFGMGSGIYFSHLPMIKLNGYPVTSFRPMPGTIFKRITKALNVEVNVRKFRDPYKAMHMLDNNLKAGIPTGMVVGVFNLPYFPAPYRSHFNAHNIVGVGKEDGRYIVSDPIMETLETISYEDLKRVRYAKGVAPPNGKLYYVKKMPAKPDINSAIEKGIKKTVLEMVKLPGPVIGVEGIKFLAKRIKKYPTKFSKRVAAKQIGQIIRMQEEIGTGGAGFRFLYAAFLQEAAQRLQNEKIEKFSKQMTGAGDLWRKFAIEAGRIVKNRSGMEKYNFLSELLLEISEKEKYIYKGLDKSLK